MQRPCADVNSPFKRKCWTNSGPSSYFFTLRGGARSAIPVAFGALLFLVDRAKGMKEESCVGLFFYDYSKGFPLPYCPCSTLLSGMQPGVPVLLSHQLFYSKVEFHAYLVQQMSPPPSSLTPTHGRRNFKDTNPLMSSLLVILRGGEPIL